MVAYLYDIRGKRHKIKCKTYQHIKDTYVFFDADEYRIAQFLDSHIIGFTIKWEKGERDGC